MSRRHGVAVRLRGRTGRGSATSFVAATRVAATHAIRVRMSARRADETEPERCEAEALERRRRNGRSERIQQLHRRASDTHEPPD